MARVNHTVKIKSQTDKSYEIDPYGAAMADICRAIRLAFRPTNVGIVGGSEPNILFAIAKTLQSKDRHANLRDIEGIEPKMQAKLDALANDD